MFGNTDALTTTAATNTTATAYCCYYYYYYYYYYYCCCYYYYCYYYYYYEPTLSLRPVLITPGLIMETDIFNGDSSNRKVSLIHSTPCLLIP